MTLSKTASALFCLALLGGIFQKNGITGDAFSLSNESNLHRGTIAKITRTQLQPAPRTTGSTLHMAEEDEASEGTEGTDDEGEDEEGPPEDPEVTALKESIAELEAALADKKSKLQYELEQCDDYSKGGYARKVADMENMKRVRSNIASTSQASATAAVLKDFLPMYDKLNTLKDSYSGDGFGTKYSELNLQKTFTTLGVTDFNVEAGDTVNNFRMKVLESEISTDQPKDTVLRQLAPGMELDGNVIRAALCVTSLGAEEAGDEESEEEGGAEEPASE
mmetsp:Transcript_30171/g.64688  ORF Transcript_30171/g.64688 Transcript_30171/m.64688 type:complete len:278 (+) Transcript_30171:193-1026(+)|eukprot:CAMPEP_0201115950 /NCGR_PEP_ID=MMETSP0850-20130426/349_1 /ASSEMBLY_ACC=CAM_ASM_000622 /TAXON_ID=183588 /ORGANISM="Pseudo-nitzschia fraudulenta, Strain WWA7" /LENGTH=277 /DNA_ID=CAMNT_0047379889 /DNA_START=128 /DNA_END=961 /DNA_ORIENTATION=+